MEEVQRRGAKKEGFGRGGGFFWRREMCVVWIDFLGCAGRVIMRRTFSRNVCVNLFIRKKIKNRSNDFKEFYINLVKRLYIKKYIMRIRTVLIKN